jgi:hypothetical protein
MRWNGDNDELRPEDAHQVRGRHADEITPPSAVAVDTRQRRDTLRFDPRKVRFCLRELRDE